MSNFDFSLNVGDKIGVCTPGTRRNYYRIATVVKVTKTRISVSRSDGQQPIVFTSKGAIGHAGSDWSRSTLCTVELAEKRMLIDQQERADREKKGYRLEMLSEMIDQLHKGNVGAYAALLASLSSREYAVMFRKSRMAVFRWRTPDMTEHRTVRAFNLREARQMASAYVNDGAPGCRLPRETIVERAPKEAR